MSDHEAQRRCSNCHRWKTRHLWLLRQWVQKSPSKCKRCYKKSAGYRLTLDAKYQETYGISLEEYELILENQLGVCDVCGKKPGKVRLAVDHDHSIERAYGMRLSIRGLICRMCNEFLAHIYDNPHVGEAMSDYLRYGVAATRTLLEDTKKGL